MDFEITEIRPKWMHGYANSPDIEVEVRGLSNFKWEDWLYMPDPQAQRKNVMLVSTNNWPWCRFAYIGNEPQGNPTYHGNCGGEYHIANHDNVPTGEVFRSRTGWSSREGVVNVAYRHLIPGEIAGVIIYNADEDGMDRKYRTGMAGYAIDAQYLRSHAKWPEGLHLAREVKRNEVYWTISTSLGEITKPEPDIASKAMKPDMFPWDDGS